MKEQSGKLTKSITLDLETPSTKIHHHQQDKEKNHLTIDDRIKNYKNESEWKINIFICLENRELHW